MSLPTLGNNFKTWDVKLIWTVATPSSLYVSAQTEETFEIYGVDRGSISISRPLTRINSLEQYNQGYQNGVPDIRLTIFTKESGPSFERMRRISTSQLPFDVSLVLAADNNPNNESNAHEGIWIDGYEEYLGCRVTNERTNYTVAEFPVREYELMALRRTLKATTKMVDDYGLASEFSEMFEGDANYSSTIDVVGS